MDSKDYLPVLDCYYYYDGPIFFKTNLEGVQSLAMLVPDDDHDFVYLVTPASDEDIADLTENRETIRNITLRPAYGWFVIWSAVGDWTRHFIRREAIPDRWLSMEGTYLDPES